MRLSEEGLPSPEQKFESLPLDGDEHMTFHCCKHASASWIQMP